MTKERIQYLQQKKIINACKETWHDLIRNKASYKQRKEARADYIAAKAKLAQLKDVLRNMKQERATKSELKELYQNKHKRGTIKKIEKSYKDIIPPCDSFKFTMLRGRFDKPEAPRIYIGRYFSGAPTVHKNRIGFITEVMITDKTYTQENIKKVLLTYFNENSSFFGDVKILFLSLNANSDRVWGVSCTTNKNNILGFQPLGNETTTETEA